VPYYGDYYAGDPGLFGFLKKVKLGRLVGGIVKAAVGGPMGVLSAVQAIRSPVAPPPPIVAPPTSPKMDVMVTVPTTVPAAGVVAPTVRVSRVRAVRAKKARAGFTARGKAESPFARRMRIARAAAARRRGR